MDKEVAKLEEEEQESGPYAQATDQFLEEESARLRQIADDATKQYNVELSNKNTMRSDLDKLENMFSVDVKGDLGEDHEFAMLGMFGECFEKQIDKYPYKLCWLDEMKQSHTRLGKFAAWEKGDDHLIMRYSNGEKCWGADNRSARIKVVCGGRNEILEVTEPNRCAYEVLCTSPVACSEEGIQKLEKEVNEQSDDLDAMEKEEL